MTTTPQAALLSESEIVVCIAKAGCIGTVKMSYESGPYDIYRPSINASRLYDAIEAAIIAKLQATQEPVQAGELPDEREAFEATVLKDNPRAVLTKSRNGCYQDDELQAMWWAWQARAALSARKPLTPLTPAQMEKGRDQIFSINNPFCPCDSKTFSKVAEWVERHHGIGLEVKP